MIETILFFLLLLVGSAIFSGTETAFTSLNEIKVMNEKEGSGSKRLLEMLRQKSSVIAAILVGNNIVNTVLAVYAGAFFDNVLVSTGMLSENYGPLVASVVTIVFLLIFGEVIPKHLAVTFSRFWMKIFSWPLWIVVRLLRPVTGAMDAFGRILISLLPMSDEDGDSPNIQELLIMARFSAKAGHIDEIERKLVARATRFNDLEAKDVMIPRRQVVSVPSSTNHGRLREIFRENMFSRIPVFNESEDNIVGIFNIKELLTLTDEQQRNFDILRHCHEPFFAPEKVKIGQLLDQMKSRKMHICVIVDEFGATAGIITLEDIIERVFGLIHDEYDEEATQTIRKIDEHNFEIRGRASLEEVEVALEIEFAEEIKRKVDTVNGLITMLKDDFPKEREEIRYQSLVFKVVQTKGMRASLLRVEKINS